MSADLTFDTIQRMAENDHNLVRLNLEGMGRDEALAALRREVVIL